MSTMTSHLPRRGIQVLGLAALGALMPVSASYGQRIQTLGQDPGLSGLRKAVVSIVATTAAGRSTGSGIMVTSTGVVATAAHVLDRATSVEVRTQSGLTLTSEGFLHIDKNLDLALIKVDAAALATATLGVNETLEVGTRLLAIGSPFGLDQTLTDGVLSAVRQDGLRRLLQVSIPVSPGSSGGPVSTPQGSVVGMVVSGLRGDGAEGLNFALPVSYVAEALQIVSARSPRAWSGARTVEEPASSQSAEPAAPRLRRAGDAPGVVNDSLTLDWGALNGVELLAERRVGDDNLTRYDDLITYAVLPNARGGTSVERDYVRAIMVGDTKFLTTWKRWGEVRTRTTLDLGSATLRTIEVSTAPVDNSDPNRLTRTQLVITDTVAELSVDGKLIDRAWVPRGALLRSMVGAAVAAYSGELPTVFFVWQVTIPNDRIQVEPVRIRRLPQRRTIQVPVPKGEEGCTAKPGGRRSVEVVTIERTDESGTSVLEQAAVTPHVLLDTRELKCLRVLSSAVRQS